MTTTKRDLATARRIANLPVTREQPVTIRGKRVWRVTGKDEMGTWNVDGTTDFLGPSIRRVLKK